MPSSLSHSFTRSTFVGIMVVCTISRGETTKVGDRDGLRRALQAARPGTEIVLAPGVYPGGYSMERLQGSADKPIIIRSERADRPAIIEGSGAGLQLTDPAYLELRDITIRKATGNGINIDDGGTWETPAHHVTLRGLVVEDVGPSGNRDGIKLSGLVDFHIEGCRVERWGDGGSAIDMVGCQRGVIVDCQFTGARGEGANGVQAKGGSKDIAVQHCRFHNAGGRAVNVGGSTGLQFFRPKVEGYEAKDMTVEDCTFIGSSAAVAFVNVDGATVRYNTIYQPTRWVVRILQESNDSQFVPSRNGTFTNNLIVFRSDLRTVVNVGGNTAPESFRFSGNVWHCADRPGDTRRLVQTPTPEAGGKYGVDPRFRSVEKGDFSLLAESPVRNAGVRTTR